MSNEFVEFGPDFTRNPYPIYARLRESCPVRRVVLHGLEGWLVTRYDDVRQALADSTLSHNRGNACSALRAANWLFADEALDLQHHMLRSDPPAHTRIRAIASGAFTKARVTTWRPRIRDIADQLIDEFISDGYVELIGAFAFPLPLMVIMELLGIPTEDRERLRTWSDTLSSGDDAAPALISETLTKMRQYFVWLAGQKRERLGSCLFDDLVAAHCEEEKLSESELISSAFQLLQGGHVTTVGMIANGMLALILHPHELDRLKNEPELIDGAIDELLRYDPPMEIATIRFTTRETRLGDTVIPGGGEAVILALASANRDSARFHEPDAIDVSRDATGHLAFGYGIHSCLGVHLARAEANIAFETLIERLDGLQLAIDPSDLIWRPNPHLRRPERLPVTFSGT